MYQVRPAPFFVSIFFREVLECVPGEACTLAKNVYQVRPAP